MQDPFLVMYCASITVSLGKSAHDLRQLRDHTASVPVQSISHHFYESLLRPAFDDPEYRNDFALWARRDLHDASLGERLAVIDPMVFSDPEELRQALLDVLEDRLAELTHLPSAAPGREFHFLRSHLAVLDTGIRAHSPEEFTRLLPHLTPGSIFYHFVEARRRPPFRADDFSNWLEGWGPQYDEIREQLATIDCYQWSLGEMQSRIARCFEVLLHEKVSA